MVESLMLLVCMLTDPRWWMCFLASFLQWIRTQMLFPIFEIISIIVNNSELMRIIPKERPWIGPTWHEAELCSWCNAVIHLIESLHVVIQCVGRCFKLLNPGQIIEIIGIILEIIRIIVFFQLNIWVWLHNENLPAHPKALLALLDTYQSSLGASDENRHPPAPKNKEAKLWHNMK